MEGWSLSHVALALAPRTLVLNVRSNFPDGGRAVFSMWLSPQRRAHCVLRVCTNSKDSYAWRRRIWVRRCSPRSDILAGFMLVKTQRCR
eukprot:8574966-Pyramimonas_sp.AAC.1